MALNWALTWVWLEVWALILRWYLMGIYEFQIRGTYSEPLILILEHDHFYMWIGVRPKQSEADTPPGLVSDQQI